MTKGIQQVVLSSFNRKNYTVSPDYYKHIDSRMMQLINQRPDIDTEFFGMSGIGVYLWWRIKSLENKKKEEYQQTMLQEYLIYYIDWLGDAALLSSLPEEIHATLMDMYSQGFYKTKVRAILENLQPRIENENIPSPSKEEIINNSLQICNCKV